MTSFKQIPDEAFLAYLKEHKPYLFDIEATINKVVAETGYGEVSVNFRVSNGKVDKGVVVHTNEKLYIFRKDNRL